MLEGAGLGRELLEWMTNFKLAISLSDKSNTLFPLMQDVNASSSYLVFVLVVTGSYRENSLR